MDVLATRRNRLPRPSDRIDLRGLQVSPICVGMVGDARAIAAAFEMGINFFFVTADMHWPRYANTRRGLAQLLAKPGRRDEVVIAGVSYVTQSEFCSVPFRELVDEVSGLERLDVLLAGGAYGHEIDARLPIYERHRERSHCGARAIGATFHDRRACASQMCAGNIDVAFSRYSASHAGARTDLFPLVTARPRAPLFTFKSTSGWTSPEKAAAAGIPSDVWLPTIPDQYRFALSCEAIDGVLVGVNSPGQLRELDEALAAGPLGDDEQDHLLLLAELTQSESKLDLRLG